MADDAQPPPRVPQNGSSAGIPQVRTGAAGAAPPPAALDLAEACVRYVERTLGVKLDYLPETLPLVDHYLEQARSETREKLETIPVVAQAAGAYFGEVVRRRYASWWRCDDDDPLGWQIEFEPVYLSIRPVELVYDALVRGGDQPELEGTSHFEIQDEDREAVAARLNELPPVPEEEFFALSTRLEVIDIAVEAMRARRMALGEPADALLTPDDYA